MAERARDFSGSQDGALLRELLGALGSELPDAAIGLLSRYVELVVSWNRKIDLTAARGARAQLEVLLVDGLVLARPELVPEGLRCVDVGSGAGAPVIPLLIARPDLRALLIEPLHKRVAFLNTALGTLGLTERAKVAAQKLDPAAPPSAAELERLGGPFDLALSRATFAPELWVPAALQLAPRALALLAGAQPPAAGRRLMEHTYALPWSSAARCIAVYERD